MLSKPRSLRFRLQLWHGLVLLGVVSTFAGLLYYWIADAEWRDVDARLEAGARYLEINLRRFPPRSLRAERGMDASERSLGPNDSFNDRPPGDGPRFERFPARPPGDEPPVQPPRRDRRGGDDPFDWRPDESRSDLSDRPDRGVGPPFDRPPMGPRDPARDRQRLMDELDLPKYPPGSPEEERSRDIYFSVWLADGQRLKSSPNADALVPPNLPPGRKLSFMGRRGYREVAMVGPGNTRIVVGKPLARELARLRNLIWRLAAAGIAVLTIGVVGGWIVSARIFRPIEAIAGTAASISATNMAKRIELAGLDEELVGLAKTMNAMFDRLQVAFEKLTRFTADASHELRTPLTILRTHAELALSRPRGVDEYQQTLTTSLQVYERLTTLVESLLTLARADQGQLELRRETVDLRRIAEQCVEWLQPLAAQRNIALTVEGEPALMRGDSTRLGQVVTNLVSNAIRYNRDGGNVTVRVSLPLDVVDKWALLEVRDTGIGIPAESQSHIFERFYRVDQARARNSGGNGLGLAISKCIVEAHGGQIGFDSQPDGGSRFWIRIPVDARGATATQDT